MKNKKPVFIKISKKRFERKLISKIKKKVLRLHELNEILFKKKISLKALKKEFNGNVVYSNIIKAWLPINLAYLVNTKQSAFYIDFEKVKIQSQKKEVVLQIPKVFSLIDNPVESYNFIRDVVNSLLCEKIKVLSLDYQKCTQLNIGAQVFLDIILKETAMFYERCVKQPIVKTKVKVVKSSMRLVNLSETSDEVKKILFSVGTPAILRNAKIDFPNIIPYRLCTHNRDASFNKIKASERKDIDTTELAEYVINSLARVNRKLTLEKLDNLCTIIGEALINAEEHSTTNHRFSIGYFQDIIKNGKHYGLFRLIIVNFGKTIYEKFKDLECPNKEVVEKMRRLSENYTQKGFFNWKTFNEESLWTLYALQEGVTSVADKKRGNGSIQFIDSFFNIKGKFNDVGEKSRMTILSGNTNITFDGTYRIIEKEISNERFKVMTFNESGNIENKPDDKFVKYVDNYFPGTMISARICFSEDDYDAN